MGAADHQNVSNYCPKLNTQSQCKHTAQLYTNFHRLKIIFSDFGLKQFVIGGVGVASSKNAYPSVKRCIRVLMCETRAKAVLRNLQQQMHIHLCLDRMVFLGEMYMCYRNALETTC